MNDPPTLIVRILAFAALFFQVVHCPAITFAEGMSIIIYELALHAWMPVPVVIVGIMVRAGFEVVASRFDPIAESGALRLAIFRGRLIPPALSFVLSRGASR